MSGEQIKLQFQIIRQHLAKALQGNVEAETVVDAAIDALDLLYEEMQTSLELGELVVEELLRQTQLLTEHYHCYYDLFRAAPIPYLVTDAAGVIQEANHTAAQLLGVPRPCLIGEPLATFIAPDDSPTFRSQLNQLTQRIGTYTWQSHLCPREGNLIAAEVRVAIVAGADGNIESLRVALYPLSSDQPQPAPESSRNSAGKSDEEEIQPTAEDTAETAVLQHPPSSLPQPFDGLQVLVVDDEADAREFITTVLESHGIRVMAVSTVSAALEALDQFHPDVLVTDIRMPNWDGYSLIQHIRALEAEEGGHLPAAAMTAYLDEDREKALQAGFEAHLHKLAQPSELVEMVAQLAKQAVSWETDLLR